MQANNADTMTDMIFVLIASLIVGIGCYYLPEALWKGKDFPGHGEGQSLRQKIQCVGFLPIFHPEPD